MSIDEQMDEAKDDFEEPTNHPLLHIDEQLDEAKDSLCLPIILCYICICMYV